MDIEDAHGGVDSVKVDDLVAILTDDPDLATSILRLADDIRYVAHRQGYSDGYDAGYTSGVDAGYESGSEQRCR